MKIYHVDIPKYPQDEEHEWAFVKTFRDKDEAIQFLWDKWRIPEEYSDLFITEDEE